jgi:two-component system chemotaxis response regulator CheV
MPAAVEGIVSLRGVLVPVVDLAKFAGIPVEQKPEIMIVTEYNAHTQAFLVEAVDTILRLDWSSMKVPPEMLLKESGGLVTAVTELSDGRLVMMLDVERVLAETAKFGEDDQVFQNIPSIKEQAGDRTVFFADDSAVARRQIERTLTALNVKHVSAINGSQAWVELQKIATIAEGANRPAKDYVGLVLTDVEMPEMDGYILTRKIRGDVRFAGIPIIMHSSLSSMENQSLGLSVGVDEYVPKFDPQRLAEVLSRRLAA